MTPIVGDIVRNTKVPDWGPGRVLEVGSDGTVRVFFLDAGEKKSSPSPQFDIDNAPSGHAPHQRPVGLRYKEENMSKKAVLAVAFLCVYMVACATGSFTQTGETFPPYEGPVKVLKSPPVDKEYVEIGWVSSSGGMVHEWTHLVKAMQKKAASKGANAIILDQTERPNTAFATYNQQFGFVGGSGTQKSMTAIAIRILE